MPFSFSCGLVSAGLLAEIKSACQSVVGIVSSSALNGDEYDMS